MTDDQQARKVHVIETDQARYIFLLLYTSRHFFSTIYLSDSSDELHCKFILLKIQLCIVKGATKAEFGVL